MEAKQGNEAVSTRARVQINEHNGWAKGVEGIALGYNVLYDTIKVGFGTVRRSV